VADGLAVMEYRTDPGQIHGFAAPFLDWSARHGKRVHIALSEYETSIASRLDW